MRDLAAEVGILSGSLFHHFPNKEAILRTVIEEGIRRVVAGMETSLQGVDDLALQLRILIRCELASIHGSNNPGFQLLVPEWRSLSSQSQAPIQKRIGQSIPSVTISSGSSPRRSSTRAVPLIANSQCC